MTKFQRLLKLRLIAVSVIVLSAIIGVIHTGVYVTSRRFVEAELILSAKAIASAVSQIISEDIDEYKGFVEKVNQYKATLGRAPMEAVDDDDWMPRELYEHDPYYKKMLSVFERIKANSHTRYIYTHRLMDDNLAEYILGAEPVDSEEHYPPTSTYAEDHTSAIAFREGQSATFGLTYYPGFGYLIGAHVPIFDENNKPIGVAGVDICGSYFSRYLTRLQLFLFLIYAVIIGITLLIITRFSVVIMEPLFKDRLTGAYTKRYAERLIQEEIAAALKENTDLALMVLDLDHFKRINDTYGHNFGDKVLAAVSETIQRSLRHKDYFIRYGGEEFITLLPNVNEDRSKEIAERIRLAVANTVIADPAKDISVRMTISIGIATLNRSSTDVHEFIDHADMALYVAKKDRNCIALYTKDTEEQLAAAKEKQGYMSSTNRRKNVNRH